MTSIFFNEKSDNTKTIVVSKDVCEGISVSIDCIGSIAETIEEILDNTDLDNIINTQFKLTTIYNLCYILKEYSQSINNRLDKLIE